MKISVHAQQPEPKPQQLVALIDLGPERLLARPETLAALPAWPDLERRRAQGELKSAYLAVGKPPLLYLPAAEAKFWDDDEKIRILAAKAFDAASERGAETLVLLLDNENGAQAAPLAAEGIALRAYQFDKYKSANPDKRKKPAVILVCPEKTDEARQEVERRLLRVDSVNKARDLINEPGSVATPAAIEDAARAVAKKQGLKIEVLDAKQLEKEGYQALLTVGRGGDVPPRMIVLTYDPAPASKKSARAPKGKNAKSAKATAATTCREDIHLGLLGKGITFDSGGVSIKPANKMWEMKGDMSGAAAVLYAIESIAREKLPIRVTAVIVTAQNYVDSRSTVPGDIFRARNGKSIHVDNTDAEGRLVLTDGLWRMGEAGVTHLVDVATLTGACVRALGTSLSGVLGNDQFADLVAEVAATQGEPCWRLPLVEEYIDWLKCDVADLNNIAANGLAGTTIGALFLREFLPAGIHWAHLDIAGTFLAETNWKYYHPGATGVMVRSFIRLAERLASEV